MLQELQVNDLELVTLRSFENHERLDHPLRVTIFRHFE
jgi:hypothetical protein